MIRAFALFLVAAFSWANILPAGTQQKMDKCQLAYIYPTFFGSGEHEQRSFSRGTYAIEEYLNGLLGRKPHEFAPDDNFTVQIVASKRLPAVIDALRELFVSTKLIRHENDTIVIKANWRIAVNLMRQIAPEDYDFWTTFNPKTNTLLIDMP